MVAFSYIKCLSKGNKMRLIRFGEAGKEKTGAILADGTRLDTSGFGTDYNEAFFG